MPVATLRSIPARIISFWLMTSASAGLSRRVTMKYWVQRIWGADDNSCVLPVACCGRATRNPQLATVKCAYAPDPQIRSNARRAAGVVRGDVRLRGAAVRLHVAWREG